jgi:sugar (pentulose or hexulose) kinase
MNHCLILDIGKTNKKAFVFDEAYRVVFEKTTRLPETTDDDGDSCENLELLRTWVLDSVREIGSDSRFNIRAFNTTAYGASFVHLDATGVPVAPLYNYLKPFPEDLRRQFFETFGGAEKMALETASPVLGHLNSGLQLYWLKHRKPQIFSRIKYALHLPQYIASLVHGQFFSEITGIGCHTMLRDFRRGDYHDWVYAEGIIPKFPPLQPSDTVVQTPQRLASGIGLHDSSAALIPYLAAFREPFVLISTGTWCITLNPFNDAPLTAAELAQDCLCYLSYEGKPVKAARYFGGHEHEEEVAKIAALYGVAPDFYRTKGRPDGNPTDVQNALDAYAAFMRKLMEKQVNSARLAMGNAPVKRIFVDGGFSGNALYMNLLAAHFPETEVCAAEVPQATALGAALAIHSAWNEGSVPGDLIGLKKYGLFTT